MKCKEKVPYHNREMAAEALRAIIAKNKRDPRNKQLVVYNCRDCGLWHVGHLRRRLLNQPAPRVPAPKPAVKTPTPGQLRRAAAKAAAKAAHDAMFADYTDTLRIARILADREIARLEALGVPKRNVR
jgi:hypothetical protein